MREYEKKWKNKKSNIFLSIFFGTYMSFIGTIDLQYDPFSCQRVLGEGGGQNIIYDVFTPPTCGSTPAPARINPIQKMLFFFHFFCTKRKFVGVHIFSTINNQTRSTSEIVVEWIRTRWAVRWKAEMLY